MEQLTYLNGMSQVVIAEPHDGINLLDLGLHLVLDGLERMRQAIGPQEAAGGNPK